MIKFELTPQEEQKYKEWALNHKCKFRNVKDFKVHKFGFMPTKYGIVSTVTCQCGSVITLTNYDEWEDE